MPHINQVVTERMTFGAVTNDKGEVVGHFFSCKIDPDNPTYLMEDYLAECAQEQHEREQFLKTHDPNRIDGYRVRRELGDKLVNLGRKVNNLSDRCHNKRFRLRSNDE